MKKLLLAAAVCVFASGCATTSKPNDISSYQISQNIGTVTASAKARDICEEKYNNSIGYRIGSAIPGMLVGGLFGSGTGKILAVLVGGTSSMAIAESVNEGRRGQIRCKDNGYYILLDTTYGERVVLYDRPLPVGTQVEFKSF